MMPTRRDVLKFAAVGALGVAGLANKDGTAMAASRGIEGRMAPEIVGIDYWIDENGKKTAAFSLAQNEKKWVFLKCFQSWCPGCHSHGLPAMKKISNALADNPHIAFATIQTVFEGFSFNTVDKVRKTQLEYDLKMPMGHDPGPDGSGSMLMRHYRNGGTPWMILISPERQVVYNGFGIDADKAIAFLKASTQT